MLSALSASAAPTVVLRLISLELVENARVPELRKMQSFDAKTHAPSAQGGKKVAPLLLSIRRLLAA